MFPDSITQTLQLLVIFHHLPFFLCIYSFTKPYCFFLLSLTSFVILSAKILISLSACLEKDIFLLVCFPWFIQNSSLQLLPRLYYLEVFHFLALPAIHFPYLVQGANKYISVVQSYYVFSLHNIPKVYCKMWLPGLAVASPLHSERPGSQPTD